MDEVDAHADPDPNANCGSDYSALQPGQYDCAAAERENGNRTKAMEQRIPIRKLRGFMVGRLQISSLPWIRFVHSQHGFQSFDNLFFRISPFVPLRGIAGAVPHRAAVPVE